MWRRFGRGSSWGGLLSGRGGGGVGGERSAEGLDVGADFGLGGAEELLRREVGEDAAGVEEDDAVGEIEGFVEVVGDEEDGLAEALKQGAHHLLHLEAGEGIERAEGLVHEEDGRVGGEGTGQACTLALAARELSRKATSEGVGGEADGGE